MSNHDHDGGLVLHVDHHGPAPLDSLPSQQLYAITQTNCDCYTLAERTQAWSIFQQRPDFREVYFGNTLNEEIRHSGILDNPPQ
jgi:hypothetical protein